MGITFDFNTGTVGWSSGTSAVAPVDGAFDFMDGTDVQFMDGNAIDFMAS